MSTQETTLMDRKPFLLPDMADSCADSGFSKEELEKDVEGLQLGFQRVKIPSGGQVQFELPSDDPDNPDYAKYLEGVIVYSHNANSYWPTGEDYDDNTPPSCQSVDGMSTPFKNVIFRRNGMSFFAGQHTGVYSLNH